MEAITEIDDGNEGSQKQNDAVWGIVVVYKKSKGGII
jgi:hypothetical protein